MHGLTPGPLLYQNDPEFIWGVTASMFIGNVLLLIMNLPLANLWAKVALIPYKLLYPMILIICMVGIYSVGRSLFDVGLLIFFGIVGYLMKKLDCPAVIIECGFLSNPAEEARLRDEAYHKQLAAAVICGYLRSQSGM